ncbi:hypothetical protein MXAN_4519 [Myxococcus xanthus DK 1622]|uniref:Uncharacterized protein n=1 Tax=Myxococcus xanthus (strain DK1622) TaxID=246197 RepID=Q1D3T6_MYXXD|nr:hypothetical protein MXAN_4519 [Myxococcus xanthus DK 1622]
MDARLIQQAIAHHGWLSPHWRVRTPEDSVTPAVSSTPFYTPEDRARALEE